MKVFVISPGLVNTDMTGDQFPEGAPWTPPELAPRLVLELASGRFDALAGRYLHAEHDPPDVLESRIDRILAEDLNAIRLQTRELNSWRPSAESRSGGRPRAARLRPRGRAGVQLAAVLAERPATTTEVSPSSGRHISAAIRPSTISPRPGAPGPAPDNRSPPRRLRRDLGRCPRRRWRFVPAKGPT